MSMAGRRYFKCAWQCGDVWKVTVYDGGPVTMCEWDEDKKDWVDCTFKTEAEAVEAGRQYEALWNGGM